MDFIWSRGGRSVGIEVKASATWRPEHAAPLRGLMAQGVLTHAHGVYGGTAERKDTLSAVWPVRAFLRELASGRILTVEVLGASASTPVNSRPLLTLSPTA